MKKYGNSAVYFLVRDLTFRVLGALVIAATTNAVAADTDASASLPASFVRALHSLLTVGNLTNSVEVGKALGLTFTEEELKPKQYTRDVRFKPEHSSETIVDLSRPFRFRIVTDDQASRFYTSLSFRILAEKQCVTKAMIENRFGVGQFRSPPVGHRASRENDRGSGIYGLIYQFEGSAKSVRVILDFEWDYCLHAVIIDESFHKGK